MLCTPDFGRRLLHETPVANLVVLFRKFVEQLLRIDTFRQIKTTCQLIQIGLNIGDSINSL